MPTVALAGYTNAGKSTLLNALTGAGVGVGERLFHTLDPTTRALTHEGRRILLTDTVGFIRKLPHALVEAFRRRWRRPSSLTSSCTWSTARSRRGRGRTRSRPLTWSSTRSAREPLRACSS